MTREEAIEILKNSTMKDTLSEQWKEAYNMAIKALEQKPFVNIPENATNGDLIQAMFPDTEYIYDPTYVTSKEDDHAFTKDWWNAPYKAEVR